MATAAVTPSAADAAEVVTVQEPVNAMEEEGKSRSAMAPVESEVLPTAETYGARLLEVASAFLPMGFIAFGGPQAHIGLFLKTFVEGKRKWLDEQRFMELMSLGQAMPGPTSTQMATAMGISRAGVLGGLISFWLFDWVGLCVLLGVGSAIHAFEETASTDGLNTYKMVMLGMGPAAISQVFTAAHALGTKVCGDDAVKIMLALLTCVVALLVENALVSAFVFLGVMVAGGIITIFDAKRPSRAKAYEKVLATPTDKGMLKRMGIYKWAGLLLVIFVFGLFIFTQFANYFDAAGLGPRNAQLLAIFTTLYKMGMSIYGGGQVVLPMLEREFVTRTGYEPGTVGDSITPIDAETFGFGLALAQSMPGPLFNFAAFLGAVVASVPGGILGFIGLFGPGIMLIYAFMPFWETARQYQWVRCGLVGMNAASIGLVFAACVTLFDKFCLNGAEASVTLIAMVLTKRFGWPPPVAIFSCAALCLCFFFLNIGGAYGDWCHIAKYGDFSTQDRPAKCGI
jgi:chromate transporter